MFNKTIFGMIFTLLLVSILLVTVDVYPVMSSGNIYIRVDGSIDPPTAPISTTDNVTYTFTDNINDSIVVERDDIVIDGAGYAIEGARDARGIGSGVGIRLSGRSNVTIKNANIGGFERGIFIMEQSLHNVISGNNVTANDWGGIWLMDSSNNTIIENMGDIRLERYSNYNSIVGNTGSIYLDSSNFNSIVGNNCSRIYLSWTGVNRTRANSIVGNNVTANNGIGIYLSHSSNSIMGNTVTANNGTGICLHWSSWDNSIVGNNVTANNGIGIYLIAPLTDNNSIVRNTVTANNGIGIYLSHSSNSIIRNTVIADNGTGINLEFSSGNSVVGNNVTMNNGTGVSFNEASGNIIHHNNFVNNIEQVNSINSTNVWDNGYEGNYWSDYNGTDLDGDGIGDTPYIINENNQDNYPLMKPKNSLFGDMNYDFIIDMRDIGVAAWSIGTYPTHPRWNIEADVNHDSKVDIKDLILIAINFGET